MLVDYRCPRCDRVVDSKDINKQSVRILKKVPGSLPANCLHCKTKISLIKGKDEGLGEQWYFVKIPS